MKKISLKPLKIAAINLLLLFLLLELVSVAFYFFRTRTFFYATHSGQGKTLGFNPQSKPGDEAGRSSIIHRIHPYFGFVFDKHTTKKLQFSQISYAANNCGILSPYDYPFKKTSNDQFIIGIFGGSVGMYYGFYELENHILTDALKRLPYFQNKQIIVLPFGMGAFKQPQQLLALNYFLSIGQNFDMVINIDGFNETALSYLNNRTGIDISMPTVHILGPMVSLANKDLSLEALTLTLEVLKLKTEIAATETSLDKCRFATCYTWRWIKLQYLVKQYREQLEMFDALNSKGKDSESLIHVNRNAKPLDDPEALQQIADLWTNTTRAMSELLDKSRISYFQVLQPNQYYSTGRKFSDAEKKIAINPGSPFEEGARKGYPQLVARIGDLEKSGVKLINAVNAFDEVTEVVYEDDCCHYNKLGNEVFARLVAREVVKFLQVESVPH